MRTYVLMTSITLIAGATLGFWTGQGSARKGFTAGCEEAGIVVVYDYKTEEHRHFHCFELEEPQRTKPGETPAAGHFVVL